MPFVRSVVPLLVPFAAAAPAQMAMQAPAACTRPSVLPAELAGWAKPMHIGAATDEQAAGKAQIVLGRAVTATLSKTPAVNYAVGPEKPGGSASYGGLFAFNVTAAGRYRVALGSGVWIDVVRDGAAITSTAHGHGPDCTGVHKMVDFDLAPGRYLLQVAGSEAATLTLQIVKRPA